MFWLQSPVSPLTLTKVIEKRISTSNRTPAEAITDREYLNILPTWKRRKIDKTKTEIMKRSPENVKMLQIAVYEDYYIYIVRAAVTLDYYSTEVCDMRKREQNRKTWSEVDKQPEKMSSFGQCIFALQSSTKLLSLRVPGHTKSPTA